MHEAEHPGFENATANPPSLNPEAPVRSHEAQLPDGNPKLPASRSLRSPTLGPNASRNWSMNLTSCAQRSVSGLGFSVRRDANN